MTLGFFENRNVRLFLTEVFCWLLAAPFVSAAGPNVTATNDGKVTAVTLYRNQALVTRTIEIEGELGNHEVVVAGLPENIVSDSLFAEGGAEVEIRAVQFRTRAVGNSPREEVQVLENEIHTVQQQIQLNQKNNELLQKQAAYLDKLEGFVAPTATTELSKGVLDAEALQQLTNFSFEKREEIAHRQIELTSELHDLQKELNLLQRKMNEITSGASKTIREAILFVHKQDPATQTVSATANSVEPKKQ